MPLGGICFIHIIAEETVTSHVGSWFLSLAKKEFRTKNYTIRGS